MEVSAYQPIFMVVKAYWCEWWRVKCVVSVLGVFAYIDNNMLFLLLL